MSALLGAIFLPTDVIKQVVELADIAKARRDVGP
jgi:hypothetical protein